MGVEYDRGDVGAVDAENDVIRLPMDGTSLMVGIRLVAVTKEEAENIFDVVLSMVAAVEEIDAEASVAS